MTLAQWILSIVWVLFVLSIIVLAKQAWKRTMSVYLILSLVFVIIFLAMPILGSLHLLSNNNYVNFQDIIYCFSVLGIVLFGLIGIIKPTDASTEKTGFSGGKFFVIFLVSILILAFIAFAMLAVSISGLR